MRTLTANDAISVWELGRERPPAEQVVTLLAAAFPAESKEVLRRLTLGQCNTRLLAVRDSVFGPNLNAYSECAGCGERLEFTFSSNAISREQPAEPTPTLNLETAGYSIQFRLLEIEDLNAAAASADILTARKQLVERCVLEARFGGRTVAAAELPEAVITDLTRRLAECDPGAETWVDLACPACGLQHQSSFDIASFFCLEMSAQGQELLFEVHCLARAYGWREREILAMSARRRRFYLEMLE